MNNLCQKTLNIIDEHLHVDAISYNHFLWVFHDFLATVFLDFSTSIACTYPPAFKANLTTYIHSILDYLEKRITPTEFTKIRINAWKEHDKSKGIKQKILRIIICGLYEENISTEPYQADDLLEIIVGTLHDLDTKYCKLFQHFFLNHTALKIYHK